MTSTAKSSSRKSASRKAPSRKTPAEEPATHETPPVTPAAADDESAVYSLAALVQTHGAATADEVFALFDQDRASLVAEGAKVATLRIATDCARMYGRASACYRVATPAQRRALRGLSADLLRIAVWAAWHGEQLYQQRRLSSSAGAGRQEQRQAQALATRDQLLIRREQLVTLLRLAAGGNPRYLVELTRAYGSIETPEELVEALGALVQLGRKYVAASDAALQRRAVAAGLDVAYLDECAASLSGVGDQLKAATASRELPAVAQSEVDLWDGLNLYLLGTISDLFEVANQLEPTVPRLVPVALRTWFKPSKSKSKPATPSTPPVPDPARDA